MHTNSVVADRVNSVDDIETRGQYWIARGAADVPRAFWFNCPGCNTLAALCLDGSAEQGRNWKITGNQDSPTLNPSINHVGCWHGWLKQGNFESC